MASVNVILGKLDRGKRLTNEECNLVRRALIEDQRKHGVWKKYPCMWECSLCGYSVNRYINRITYPDNYIESYRYCPRCGAEMEVE